ncbi:hypothetical protein KHC17_24985 (plasmid) [Agrobacterium salinitolerans]|uniref:hypothetical protein n=1 Tax=Agrobacterium salinitolerans TaxID=1183413 RepID=UPI001C21BB33|nr:hypothetical protein [Agrobacterium salinitolerans]QXC52508.1 hypothetical protein KHC17_24985 [Agrobacterium salinitolerans]
MIKLLKFALTLSIGVTVMFGYLGYRWHQYVTNTDSPYDEVGIALNNHLPGPVTQWGCDKLKAKFGNGLPPLGCAADDGKQWK